MPGGAPLSDSTGRPIQPQQEAAGYGKRSKEGRRRSTEEGQRMDSRCQAGAFLGRRPHIPLSRRTNDGELLPGSGSRKVQVPMNATRGKISCDFSIHHYF
jgi:hypothetical protein